ncbi:MAG: hypothetical protein Q9M36_10845 [Sulfurovum sp.]|nr:hypothetical protein [Sulfurovum sp.]
MLGQLPRLIQGFGNTYQGYGANFLATLIIVVDLDSKNKEIFLKELNEVLMGCNPQPSTYFCLAIEEGEAWFLGDIAAITIAYPLAKQNILNQYIPDSICGTWEVLANAIYTGGLEKLKKKGSHEVGKEKSSWAINISPHMNIKKNTSPSFCYFRDTIQSHL